MMNDHRLEAVFLIVGTILLFLCIVLAANLDYRHLERMALIERLSPEEARERLDQMEEK